MHKLIPLLKSGWSLSNDAGNQSGFACSPGGGILAPSGESVSQCSHSGMRHPPKNSIIRRIFFDFWFVSALSFLIHVQAELAFIGRRGGLL
jgi:hypothetical protein